MKSQARRATWLASTAFVMACVFSTALWAGGSGFGDDEGDPDEDAGPPYFGFVKDDGGSLLPDAKVVVEIKNGSRVVVRTNILGAYRVPGFSKDIDPKKFKSPVRSRATSRCAHCRRPRSGDDPKSPIETECIMQRG